MFRLIFVDSANDKREIYVAENNIAETFYNGKGTGRFFLRSEEVHDILQAKTEDEAFAVLENIGK